MVGAYIRTTAITAIVRIIRTTIRGTAGPLTHGIGARPGPGAMTRIGTEDGAILTGHGVHHVHRLITITATAPDHLGIPLRPGPTDLTARHLPAVHRGVVRDRRITDMPHQRVAVCLAPVIWDAVAATAPQRHHRHLHAPADMLRRPPVRVLRQDIAAVVLADAMATALRPPIVVAAHTHLRAIRPRRAATAVRIAVAAAEVRIVVAAAEVRMVAVAAEVADAAVVDKNYV